MYYPIALILFLFFAFSPPLLAEETSLSWRNFRQPPPPPDAPQRRSRGTGSRGDCQGIQGKLRLVPMIPVTNWGLTLSQTPILWFHISYPPEAEKIELQAQLLVEDRDTDGKEFQRSYSITLPSRSGIFPVPLKAEISPEQWYRWYLAIACNEDSNSQWEIEGFIYRQNSQNIPGNWQKRSPQERVAFYVESSIWYDAFAEAALLACDSNSTDNSWQALLISPDIALDKITNENLICLGIHSSE